MLKNQWSKEEIENSESQVTTVRFPKNILFLKRSKTEISKPSAEI